MNNPLNQDLKTEQPGSDSQTAFTESDVNQDHLSTPVALSADDEAQVQKAEEKSLSEHKAKVLSKPEAEQITTQHSPSARYTQALMSGEFQPDEDQALAVDLLETLWQDLMQRYEDANGGLRGAVRLRRSKPPKGVYMWGGVGRGKTWMMDMFFDSLSFRRKMRLHFHHFMKRVHAELAQISGEANPLEKVADSIYKDAVVICFDEFFVSHVSDAMILGDLFSKLFDRGVTLVATSNVDPDLLYADGLHRDRFMGVIEMLKSRTQVVNIDAGLDYRLRVLKQAQRYVHPLGTQATEWVMERFNALTNVHERTTEAFTIGGREVQPKKRSENVLWCSFRELCIKARSASDYIEIGARFETVIISDVPELTDEMTDPTRRLIYLVDEFYDQRVNLLISAEQTILELYDGRKLRFEIERTRSRLLEMQSLYYMESAHLSDQGNH